MNILIPHTWLLEHLDTTAKPEEIQKYLSLCGPSVERINSVEGESVYDIEITTNRVDCMSIRGIAREAAVILQESGFTATLKPLKRKSNQKQKIEQLRLPKVFNNSDLNKRTMFVILKNIKRNPTPDWMAKRLRQVEMNVHDAVIDITNYVTHELGHPCHAFDYDKLIKTGGEIHIIEAQPNEKFTTLDGESFETVGGEVVFKNKDGKIIDLPSIKGTQNTSIDENTKNVLLLMESIRPDKVRFASMTHAIRTTAAQLMEKNVDPLLMNPTMEQAIKLYQDICQAELGSNIIDQYDQPTDPTTITVNLKTIENYLGLSVTTDEKNQSSAQISVQRIQQILEKLECQVTVKKSDNSSSILVTPPSFRPDLAISADIIEEIARIYGYHNLPSTIMPTKIPLTKPRKIDFHLENTVKHFLASIGWQEIYTYSMVSQELAKKSGFTLSQHLKIQNPLTEDREYMRRTILPSLEEVIDQNPLANPLSVFEIANLYHPQKNDIPKNETHLSMVSSKEYRQVKGDIEALLDQLFISNIDVIPLEKPKSMFSQQARVEAQSTDQQKITIGKIGVLHSGNIGAGFNIHQLIKVSKKHPSYQPIPKTATITEELTFTLPEFTQVGNVINSIETSNPFITKVTLVDDPYKHNYTFTIYYHNPNKNITSQDIKPIRKKVVIDVSKKFKAQLVGNLK